MATKKRKTTANRRRPIRYFYLNGKLHKKLLINRGKDIIMAWSYPDAKRVGYTYSDLLKKYEMAFTTKEVCEMICRGRTTVELAVAQGQIPRPQITYGLETRNEFKYMWSEQDIMNLHDYLMTLHRGRPRHDGMIVVQAMPNKRELRAMIRQNQIVYVKTDDGEFIPTFRAEEF